MALFDRSLCLFLYMKGATFLSPVKHPLSSDVSRAEQDIHKWGVVQAFCPEISFAPKIWKFIKWLLLGILHHKNFWVI